MFVLGSIYRPEVTFSYEILQVIVLELILILVILGGENLCKENIPVITALAISVFLVYVLVSIVSWLLDVRTAKAVMKELSEYQNSVLK